MKIHVPIQPVLEITALDECMDTTFCHPYYFPGEFHPFWEMLYVLEGKLQVAINEDIYTLQKGDIIIYKPMEFHRVWSVEGVDSHAFILGFCARGALLSALESGAYSLTPPQQAQILSLREHLYSFLPRDSRHLLKQMLKYWDKSTAQIHVFVNSLENFLVSLTTHPKALSRKAVSNSTDAQTYRAIVAELNANLESWITTKEIAEKLHCSPAHINRIFSRYSDIGVHKYLLKLKIAAAIRMLRNNVPVSEVSARLAFSNQNYFSSVFKRETGFPPTQYIRQITNPATLRNP